MVLESKKYLLSLTDCAEKNRNLVNNYYGIKVRKTNSITENTYIYEQKFLKHIFWIIPKIFERIEGTKLNYLEIATNTYGYGE